MNMARCHVFGSPELGHPKSHPKNAKKTKNIDDETNSIDHIIDAFFRSRLLSNPIEAKAGARNPMAAPRLLLETAVHLGHMLRQLLVLELVELGSLAQRKHWSYGKGHTYMVNHGLIMSEKQ
jgi:hypothetical protein